MAWIERLRPQRVLDIGMGHGKYGFLIRERVDNFEFNVVIEGVEVFAPYVGHTQRTLYDEIHNVHFLDFDFGPVEYDLALMIDVLEHFVVDEGYYALDKALTMAQHVLISTPLGYPQGPVYGNEYETHRSEWPSDKLLRYATARQLGIEFLDGGTPDSVICAINNR